MTEAQVTLAHALLQASLSAQGYQKATDIILIEDLLNQSGDANAYADLYFVGIFDEPSMDSPWGWQFDGHHLALNFTAIGNEVTFSPSLWGTYPSIWEGGTYDGLRPMEDEEVLAWSFVQSLSDEQLEVALVSEVDPGDLYAGPHQDDNLPEPDGLPIADLTSDQRGAVIAMIETYVGNLTDAHAALRMAEIEETLDDAMIAWMGSVVEGESMYYRIQGSRVLVEFDHTNGPDHFHAVYRDPANDYGQNWLQRHRSEFHGTHPIQH